MLYQAMQQFQIFTGRVKSVKVLRFSLIFQRLHPTTTAKSRGSMLGIKTDASLIVALVSISWKREEDDVHVDATAQELLSALERCAVEKGMYNRHKYMNYAGGEQDPIPGYGKGNKRRLQETSLKYDLHGAFQKSCVGGYKLFGSPQTVPTNLDVFPRQRACYDVNKETSHVMPAWLAQTI